MKVANSRRVTIVAYSGLRRRKPVFLPQYGAFICCILGLKAKIPCSPGLNAYAVNDFLRHPYLKLAFSGFCEQQHLVEEVGKPVLT